jgi:transposase
LAVSGANTHDKWLVEETLDSIPVERPDPADEEQHMCMDKGYDYRDVRQTVDEWGYTAHIKSRGQEERERKANPEYRARRWVSERTHSWMNRFRRLLIRWEKKPQNYLALLHLSCAYIAYSAAGVLG